MRQILLLCAAILAATNANADGRGSKSEVLTANGGVLCFSPINLREGIVAARRGDERGTRELGCMITRAGIRAVRIAPTAPLGDDWQVRLFVDALPAITVWGEAWSFTAMDGKKLWPY